MNSVVIAIPPSYDSNQDLELNSTISYIRYLEAMGATHVMTTAGTSQFNLLNIEETHAINKIVSQFAGHKILGIPPVAAIHAVSFVKQSRLRSYIDNKTKLMALYPDRFYNDQVLSDYIKSICDVCGDSIYVHAQKMRNAIAGEWNYEADILNRLFDDGYLYGIKEEHSSLEAAYNLVNNLSKELHIIVAGGSMRRFAFLESAGANALLSGIGNIYPELEIRFVNSKDTAERNSLLKIEAQLFDVFMRQGWHRSLREALRILDLTCFYDRQPWPVSTEIFTNQIRTALLQLDKMLNHG